MGGSGTDRQNSNESVQLRNDADRRLAASSRRFKGKQTGSGGCEKSEVLWPLEMSSFSSLLPSHRCYGDGSCTSPPHSPPRRSIHFGSYHLTQTYSRGIIFIQYSCLLKKENSLFFNDSETCHSSLSSVVLPNKLIKRMWIAFWSCMHFERSQLWLTLGKNHIICNNPTTAIERWAWNCHIWPEHKLKESHGSEVRFPLYIFREGSQ